MENDSQKLGAVILGGNFHSLGAARNLAEHDVPVCVLDNGPCVSRYSRAVKYFAVSPPTNDEPNFIEFLIQNSVEMDIQGWVLIPSTDEYVRIVAQNHDLLSKYYLMTIPSWDVIQYLYDKRLTYQLAEDRKIPIPKTYNPQNIDDLASIDIDYPVVLKPAISKKFMAETKKKAFRADNEEEMITFYKRTAAIIDPSEILIQEFIPGGAKNLYSFIGYFKSGKSIASLSARRSRQHPMDFGRASTFVESMNIPEIEMLALQLLKGIEFSGLAEIEFMYDLKDERFELLEVNPRLWGWHSIAVHAGLDLPHLAYIDAVGQEVLRNPIRNHVKWVRLTTDIPVVILEILSGRITVREYLSSMSGDLGFAVFSLNDPLPFIADLFLGPYNYYKSRGF